MMKKKQAQPDRTSPPPTTTDTECLSAIMMIETIKELGFVTSEMEKYLRIDDNIGDLVNMLGTTEYHQREKEGEARGKYPSPSQNVTLPSRTGLDPDDTTFVQPTNKITSTATVISDSDDTTFVQPSNKITSTATVISDSVESVINHNFVQKVEELSISPEIRIDGVTMIHLAHLKAENEYKMGLFPTEKANFGWSIINGHLHLWTYDSEKIVQEDVTAITLPKDQNIWSIGLVSVPEKVQKFGGSAHWWVVFAVGKRVMLYGIKDKSNKLAFEDKCCTIDTHSEISSVAGTSNGRIFLGGRNGALYEVVLYKKLNALSGNACSLGTSFGGSFLSGLISGKDNTGMENMFISTVVDKTRSSLYTLSSSGLIQLHFISGGNNSSAVTCFLTTSQTPNHTCTHQKQKQTFFV